MIVIILYHITPDLDHSGKFQPRIPLTRLLSEDDTTPRICVSKTIEGALTGIPQGGSRLGELLQITKNQLKLFIIDTDELDIPNENIYTDNYLFENDLVIDADHTDEYWITKPITVPQNMQRIIIPESWENVSIDRIPYSVHQLSETEYDDDIEQAYYDIFEESIPCGIKITNLKYKESSDNNVKV